MMDQQDIDQMAFLVVNKKLREEARKAASAAIAEVDIADTVYQVLGDVDTELFDKIVEAGNLIKSGGVTYISIRDAQEMRWEQEESSGDAFRMSFTDETPLAPPF